MRRRRAIALVAAASAVRAPMARAQQPGAARIGILVLDNPGVIRDRIIDALRQRGLVDGRTAVIDFRSAGGATVRLDEIAEELARLPVDILIAWQTPAALAAKRATRSIPIVMSSGDPVATGLVDNLARPGGNVTGFAAIAAEIAGKPVEVMRETLPSLRRLGVLVNEPDPFSAPFLAQIRRAAARAGLFVHDALVRGAEGVDAAMAALAADSVDAVFVQPSLPHARVVASAHRHRLPSFSIVRSYAEAGGLLSYSSTLDEATSHVASYVERVLKGARPAELPVAQPTRFELVVNLAAARALGVPVPPSILARADEVIE